MDFMETKIGEIGIEVIDGDRGKNYPHKDEMQEAGYCLFLSANNVTKNGFVFSEKVFITKEKDTILRNGKLKRGDIVLTTRGTVGNVAYYDDSIGYENMRINSGMLIVRCKDSNISAEYLYNVLRSERFQCQIRSIQTGSAQPQLPKSHFLKMSIAIPKIEIQKKIARIMSNLDTKISFNKKINKNLEEQIKLLCRSWLIDFVQFDGIQPSSWSLRPFSDIAEFISGYSYKGNELMDSTQAMATIKNFNRNGGFKLDGYKEIIPSSKLKETQYVELFDTLVAHTDLTQNAEVIGNAEPVLSFAGYESIIFSMDLVKVLPKDNISKFLIAALLQDGRFKAHALGYINGTTVLHLSKKALSEFELLLPDNLNILTPLAESVEKMYRLIAKNIDESYKLSIIRDTLLPKLMSGELDVSNINI